MRRVLVTLGVIGISILAFLVRTTCAEEGPGVTPDEALQKMKDGNARYMAGKSEHANQDEARRALTSTKGQHPFATVLSCSDSRVPVEILFDQGIGDVFVIRVAGNVCHVDEIGSAEYGVGHLATPLMVVLGHTKCGAVTAVATGAELHGSIPPLVENIRPAVEKVKKAHPELEGEALVAAAVETNVWQAIEDLLRGSPETRERVKEGRLKVVGAVYDLTSGKVRWLGNRPEQDRLPASGGGH